MATKSALDKATFVAQYVAKGGAEHDGVALYEKMIKNQDVTIQSDDASDAPEAPSVDASDAPLVAQLSLNETVTPLANLTQPAASTAPEAGTTKRKRGRPPINRSECKKSKNELKLFNLSLDIEENPAPENNHLGAIATAMIYASLPHSAVDGAVFKRKNGDVSITILNDPEIGIPYGKVPRLITAFLCTEVMRTKEPVINLGRSKSEFAKKLGINSRGGGEVGGLSRLTEQAKRLFTSHITLTGSPNSQFHWRNISITESGMLLWSPHLLDKKSPWESQLMLSPTFFKECLLHSVPIDLRVLHALRSPMAIDIYIWLSYRYNTISKPTPISWKQLKWQLGANYEDSEKGLSNFIIKFKANLRLVTSVYPEAKFRLTDNTIILLPSRPHVMPKLTVS